MATCNVGVLYGQYGGTNTIKVAISRVDDPSVEVATAYAAGPFTQYDFFFPNLLRGVTYQLKRYQVDNTDHSHILQDYGDQFTFIANNYKIAIKGSVQWQAGVNIMADGVTVFPAGVNSFTEPDWIGWDIEQFHDFSDIYERGPRYVYDSTTGTLAKAVDNDIFEQSAYYWVSFKPQINEVPADATGSAGAMFTDKLIITASTTLTAADWGKKILLKPNATFITVTLPVLTSIGELKVGFFEMERSELPACCAIVAANGDAINWLHSGRTTQYICPSESFEIYKEIYDSDSIAAQWRIQNADGNWRMLGEWVYEDSPLYNGDTAMALNKLAATGTPYDTLANARFYNDYVLKLPTSQVCEYNVWASGSTADGPNKYKFSKANAQGIAYMPDLTELYLSGASTSRIPSSYAAANAGNHRHAGFIDVDQVGSGFSGQGLVRPSQPFALKAATTGSSNAYTIVAHTDTATNITVEPTVGISSIPMVLTNGLWVAQDSSISTQPNNRAARIFVRV